jgi:hypothetical protein
MDFHLAAQSGTINPAGGESRKGER